MVVAAHLRALRAGPEEWRTLRKTPGGRNADLSGADLRSADLRRFDLGGVDLRHADASHANLEKAFLRGANLTGAKLIRARLRGSDLSYANLADADLTAANLEAGRLAAIEAIGADLRRARLRKVELGKGVLINANLNGANLTDANLTQADLTRASLSGANLTRANLTQANLTQAHLTYANLTQANLVQTVVVGAHLSGSRVYGVSIWDVDGQPADEQDLTITPYQEAEVTVDKLKMAQFIYLLLSNEEIRDVIDTITSKAVLILGRFTPERRAVLDFIRTELRERHNYSPIVFDFEKPTNKSLTDTVRLLASIARFMIVDLSDARSANYELGIVAQLGLRRTPLVIIAQNDSPTMAMLADILAQPEIVDGVRRYRDLEHLSTILAGSVIEPAESRWRQLNPPIGI
jgi:uncharacterized protein YjbI with pentapeptide repeats